ncbi:VIT family protein [Actinomyces sp. B33]|uniref:VIT1/CCC1 transporter family protein n=1 Tax=Actinomyces sp. B33 TaxID=2942131 RepID=UPI002341A748|nr:VIT family protein [Actinomyces sp. B33]MDC4232871.1 VIT family protein [Actinomyces sp. B33]
MALLELPRPASSAPLRFGTGAARAEDRPPEAAPARSGGSLAGRLNWLRAGVLGANDGIVSISGLLVGVAAVDPSNTLAIAIAGLAGIASAAVSMSVGEYVSVSTQRDTERQVVASTRRLLDEDPVGQERRLVRMWRDKGLSEATATAVARELGARDALGAHMAVEHNIDAEDLTNPWAAALSSFLAFLAGSLLPLATMLLLPPGLRIAGTMVSVVVALAATGWISAVLGRAPRARAVVRLVVGGAAAMALTYGVGHLFGVSV